MARQRRKRKLVFRPGLMEASHQLGVTYSHLRRVIIGERQGKSLLRRYAALNKAQAANTNEATIAGIL
jgi:hypothetical protein